VFRDAEPVAGQPNGVGEAGHNVPGTPVHAGRTHSQQHLVVARLGPVDLLEPQDVGLTIDVLDDRLHRHRLGRHVFGRCLSGSLLKSYHALLVLSVGGEITSAAWWHPNHALAHRHHLPHTQHVEQRRRLTEPPLTPARVKRVR
jgi:hypothetical protein